LSVAQELFSSSAPKIGKSQKRLADFYFFPIQSSLFTKRQGRLLESYKLERIVKKSTKTSVLRRSLLSA